MRLIAALLVACIGLAGCSSPEAGRARGSAGADVGNRSQVVEMHDGSDPYWRTPKRITSEHPPLESARHAAELSRR